MSQVNPGAGGSSAYSTSPGFSATDSFAATGAATGSANPLTSYYTRITSTSPNPAFVALLLSPALGTCQIIDMDAGVGNYVKVYPGASAQINGQGAGVVQPVTAQTCIMFVYGSTNNWYGFPFPKGFISSTGLSGRMYRLQLDDEYNAAPALDVLSGTFNLSLPSGISSHTVTDRSNGDQYLTFNTASTAKAANFPRNCAWPYATTLVPAGTTQTIDWTTGSSQTLSLASATGTVGITMSNGVAGARYTLLVLQGAGSRNVSWTTPVKWPAGTPPTITVTNGKYDKIVLDYDGTNYYGTFWQNF